MCCKSGKEVKEEEREENGEKLAPSVFYFWLAPHIKSQPTCFGTLLLYTQTTFPSFPLIVAIFNKSTYIADFQSGCCIIVWVEMCQ
jgi:hypothetical protein